MPIYTIMENTTGTAYSGCDEISDRIDVPNMDAARDWADLWCAGQDVTRIAGSDEVWYAPMAAGNQNVPCEEYHGRTGVVKAGASHEIDASAVVVWLVLIPFVITIGGIIWWVMSIAIHAAGGGL